MIVIVVVMVMVMMEPTVVELHQLFGVDRQREAEVVAVGFKPVAVDVREDRVADRDWRLLAATRSHHASKL